MFPTLWLQLILWVILEKGYVLLFLFSSGSSVETWEFQLGDIQSWINFFFFFCFSQGPGSVLAFIYFFFFSGRELGRVLHLNSVLQSISSELPLRPSGNVTWKPGYPYNNVFVQLEIDSSNQSPTQFKPWLYIHRIIAYFQTEFLLAACEYSIHNIFIIFS